MITSRFVLLSVALAGCAAAAYTIARRPRQREKWQLEEGLRAWEDEGGNLAARADQTVLPVPAVPVRLASLP